MKRLVEISVAAVAVGLFASHDASALELGTPAAEHPYRSSQNFALEFRISPYRAQVDEESGLSGSPLAKNFGTNPRILVGVEFDWQVFRIPHVGTIGPAASIGYVSMSRKVTTVSGRTSGDETGLSIYPVSLLAVFRADFLFRDLGIPFVPYGKAGIGAGLWRATSSSGTSSANNVSGKGTSFGTNIALGISLALDGLDPGASRNMDNATGINGTYVFIEANWLALNGLAQDHALHVGSNTWTAGLAFEF